MKANDKVTLSAGQVWELAQLFDEVLRQWRESEIDLIRNMLESDKYKPLNSATPLIEEVDKDIDNFQNQFNEILQR